MSGVAVTAERISGPPALCAVCGGVGEREDGSVCPTCGGTGYAEPICGCCDEGDDDESG